MAEKIKTGISDYIEENIWGVPLWCYGLGMQPFHNYSSGLVITIQGQV